MLRRMRLPNPTESERRQIAGGPAYTVLLLAFLLHVSLGSYAQRTHLPAGIAYGQLLFFFGIPWLAVASMGLSPRHFLAFTWPRGWTWPWIVLASVTGFLLAGGLNSLNQWLVGPEVARFFDSTRVLRDRPFGEQIGVAVGVTLLAPLGEEVLFRGYLLRVFRARYGTTAALLLTSGIFGAMHLNPASFLALFTLGLLFGLLRLATGSIVPALVGHGIQNGITAVAVLAGVSSGVEPEIDPLVALATAAVTAPIVWLALGMVQRTGAAETEEPGLGSGSAPVRVELDRLGPLLWIWVGAAILGGALLAFLR
jgi:membrane protease YdiL (CAAX protease family)